MSWWRINSDLRWLLFDRQSSQFSEPIEWQRDSASLNVIHGTIGKVPGGPVIFQDLYCRSFSKASSKFPQNPWGTNRLIWNLLENAMTEGFNNALLWWSIHCTVKTMTWFKLWSYKDRMHLVWQIRLNLPIVAWKVRWIEWMTSIHLYNIRSIKAWTHSSTLNEMVSFPSFSAWAEACLKGKSK